MINESDLKLKCSPDFIMFLCEMAEGFEYKETWSEKNVTFKDVSFNWATKEIIRWGYFPLLIHRACKGWNKIERENGSYLEIDNESIWMVSYGGNFNEIGYEFENYQPQSLTQAECACLDCLIDIFGEEKTK